MCELIKIFENIKNNSKITLENKIYHVYEEDCHELFGYFCSNTATIEQNPKGNHKTCILIKDKKNVLIDGDGATVLVHGVITPFIIDNCTNVIIKNLTIEYNRPTMSEFFVKEKRGDEYLLEMTKDTLYSVRDDKIIWQGDADHNGTPHWERPYRSDSELSMFYNPQTEKTYFLRGAGTRFPCVPEFTQIKELDDKVLAVKVNGDIELPVGCIIQSRNVIRNELGGFIRNSKNVELNSVNVRAMHGFGILAQFTKNIKYINLDCTPKQDKTITSNADFFHFSGCFGKIVIDGAKASGGHDDFVNVHGTHLKIIDTDTDNKTILVRFSHNETWGFFPFYKGDRVEFIKWNTLQSYFKSKVLLVKKINNTDFELTLNKLPQKIELGKDVLENVSKTAKVLIKNCYFGPSMGRGILCLTRKKAIIKNNVFYKTGGCALHVADDCNFWFESGIVNNLKFIKNRLIDCSYGVNSPNMSNEKKPSIIEVCPNVMDREYKGHVHKKITIKNNIIYTNQKDKEKIIKIRATKKTIIKNNDVREIE